jgi:hypothetical protein
MYEYLRVLPCHPRAVFSLALSAIAVAAATLQESRRAVGEIWPNGMGKEVRGGGGRAVTSRSMPCGRGESDCDKDAMMMMTAH